MAHASSADESISVSVEDIREAASQGVISQADCENLIYWACSRNRTDQHFTPIEQAKGFNIVTVAYYFGAMLMISACAWFLGDKWDALGSGGILTTTVVYFAIAASLGWWLRTKGYVVGGGLLITVAVCLTPLIVYSIGKLTGWWPTEPPEINHEAPYLRPQRIVVELSTIAISLVALFRVRFAFLINPLLISFFAISMEVATWCLGDRFNDKNTPAWISVAIGSAIVLLGFVFDRIRDKTSRRSEDFAFWTYLFGLMTFWISLTWIDSNSEAGKFLYFLINIGLIAVSLYLRRSVFLVFGALGVSTYLGHLAYEVFKDSILFPFILAFIGLIMIVGTVFAQKFLRTSGRGLP